MLIRHNEKTSEPPHGKDGSGSKSAAKKVALRERDVSELKHFVRDQIEKYRLDRDRLEKELHESRQDVEALSAQLERFRELLTEHNIQSIPAAKAPDSKQITLEKRSVLRAPVEDHERERYEVKGARAAREDEDEDAVLPPIEPPTNVNHLSTTELLFVRAQGAGEELPAPVPGSLRLAIVTIVVVCISMGLLYSEQITQLVGVLFGRR